MLEALPFSRATYSCGQQGRRIQNHRRNQNVSRGVIQREYRNRQPCRCCEDPHAILNQGLSNHSRQFPSFIRDMCVGEQDRRSTGNYTINTNVQSSTAKRGEKRRTMSMSHKTRFFVGTVRDHTIPQFISQYPILALSASARTFPSTLFPLFFTVFFKGVMIFLYSLSLSSNG